MAKTRDKLLDRTGSARPYIQRALTDEDLRRIEAELPAVAGERYDESGMASVNL